MKTQVVTHEMGATLTPEGVAFRVWAPNAGAVGVAGTFNDWKPQPLEPEENGHWYGFVPEAKAGDEYKFQIGDLMRNDPYAREMTNSAGNSVVHDPAFEWGEDSYALPPLNELILYEMHIGTFTQGGTFASAIERLDHLAGLGVNAIEVMPCAEFAGDISWGYNPAHPFAVDSSYGGPLAFKEFVKQCHRRGIGVILDVVYNHFGPSDLDLWCFDGWCENGKGGIYFYNDWRSETPWGDTRPDYGRPEVRRYIRDNAMMWLEEYRVDGLRYDATLWIRRVREDDPGTDLPEGYQMVQAINSEIRERFPAKVLIAEDLQNNDYLTRPVSEGGCGFHAQWEAAFVHPVRQALIAPLDEQRFIQGVAEALQHTYNGDPFQRVIYTESHDEVANGKQRVPSEIAQDSPDAWFAKKRSVLGAVLVLTAPGVPMLFQGQEFLEDGWFDDTVPLDWDKRQDYRGVLRVYRDLIRLRRSLQKTCHGLRGSNLELLRVDEEAKVLAYRRWLEGGPNDDVVVALNFSTHLKSPFRIGFPAPGPWSAVFCSDWEAYGDEYDSLGMHDVLAEEHEYDGRPFSAELTLAPYTAVILCQVPG